MNIFIKHKKLIIWLSIFVLMGGFWYYNNKTVKITEVTLNSPKINNDITIVQLTDLHGQTFGIKNRRLISKIKKINPDFICVTGDMYTNNDAKGQQTAEELMLNLAEIYKVYFVRGEHDKSPLFEQALEIGGVRVLSYDLESVTVGKTTLNIYGINNVYYSDTFDLLHEFNPPNEDRFNLLLAHIPNFEPFARFGVDLTLSGDSHGGQVRLPYIGALNHNGVWFPKFMYGGEYYDKGLYEMNGSKLFVSVGLGSFPVPIRLFNRPEIAVIKLSPAE